jgi:hypothetical protein
MAHWHSAARGVATNGQASRAPCIPTRRSISSVDEATGSRSRGPTRPHAPAEARHPGSAPGYSTGICRSSARSMKNTPPAGSWL